LNQALLTGVPPDPPFLLPFALPTARVGGRDHFFEVAFLPFFYWRGVPRNRYWRPGRPSCCPAGRPSASGRSALVESGSFPFNWPSRAARRALKAQLPSGRDAGGGMGRGRRGGAWRLGSARVTGQWQRPLGWPRLLFITARERAGGRCSASAAELNAQQARSASKQRSAGEV